MNNAEIPREQWMPLLQDFSKQHQGWITTVEVLGSGTRGEIEAGRLPLVGISVDLKDHENRIEVMVGDRPGQHVTHIINAPKRLWLKPAERPAREALKIESEDGTTTLVYFNPVEQADHLLSK